jgi:hypothetical protein
LEEFAMQAFKSASMVVGVTLPMLVAACEVDQPISPRSNYADAGTGGSGGSGPSGTSGSVSSGGSVSNGTSGTNASGGSGGAGVSGAAGTAGAAGSADMDASDDGAGEVVDAGPSVPEASTCAGFALQFDGVSSYGLIDRKVQDDFTLEAWLKTSQTSLTGMNFWEGSGLIYADMPMNVDDFGTSMLNGHLTMGVGNPDTTLQGTSAINTGQWVHIATTRQMSTGTIQVIVNGVIDGSQVVAAQTRSLTAPPTMTIGGNNIDFRYLSGTLDELRIWNVVRTPADITSTMHKTLTGNETGLVGYWKFDEGTGDTSGDQSSAKSNGAAALHNGVQWVPSDAPICP